MKRKVLSLLMAAALFGSGFGMAHAGDAEENAGDEPSELTLLRPVLDALMFSEDTDTLVAEADKMNEKHVVEALVLYMAATREEPENIWAPYQAAALLARMGNPDIAQRYLRLADQRGIWFAPFMAEDDDFSAMRASEKYQDVLANAKQRYKTKAEGKVGAMSVLDPAGETVMPAGGWPVVVWLHGYGVNGDVGSRAEESSFKGIANQGAIVIGVNGTEMLANESSFRWAGPGYERTQKAVQQALTQLAGKREINRKQIYLMGFSQGSQHAGALLAQHPQDYAGALLMSPGGNQASPKSSTAKGKRIYVLNGKKEHQSNQAMTQDFRELLSKGNTLKFIQHDGGHTFPDDWKDSLPKAVRWLMSKES
ncbi:alpha/beta hydrolase [Janthinobacterium fluminis]|uniref:Alpha/beta hydrolase-fold protein n=1 Tax=Janthinobacterium fluminis TaxID=2987524 RepID=A0ABT5JWI8_9BURK|nr:alpha/beta hydrolase-fold protein [Janthinobacterium fluminis]MDC8757097.1 alpha/beta hydrolase-fold protein [Janthinobacterium fluminis]